MPVLRRVPVVTLVLVPLIIIIQLLRMSGGSHETFVFDTLHHGSWETFYNQPWRALTSPFIHQNLLHLLENLIFLVLFGRQIERSHGPAMMLLVFFGALLTGYVVYVNVMHDGIIGISGGVCGLFGFSLIANRRKPWWTTLRHRPLHLLYTADLIWAVIVDVTNLVPYEVAHLNHIVGILFGMAFGIAFLLTPRGTAWRWIVAALPVALFASLFYSPWQLEWRLVKQQPAQVTADAKCQQRSMTQDDYVHTMTTFVNGTAKPIAFYWLDYEGHARYYQWLRPGDSFEQDVILGQPWCVVDVDSGAVLQAVRVTDASEDSLVIQ